VPSTRGQAKRGKRLERVIKSRISASRLSARITVVLLAGPATTRAAEKERVLTNIEVVPTFRAA